MRSVRDTIPIPRWILVGKYAMFALLGFVVSRAGAPTIELFTTEAYLFWYGIAILSVAVLALVGSLTLNSLEMVGSLSLWCLLLVYVGASASRALSGHIGTQSIAIVLLIVSMLPAARGFSLLIHQIRTRVKHVV